ncbi:GbsR/MarR family transcriptional regulator [Oxynema aestuarii]|nr:MarR family transcriptional regulator [Oxynema aestuarii]
MSIIQLDEERRQFELKRFVEEVGVLFELMGLPRMAGRILGWLLISSPPHQSFSELARGLQASKGSISSMTRLLIQAGIVEKISLPGDRQSYFQIQLGAWSELIRARLAQMRAIREVAERGLTLLEGEDPERKRRLEEMRDVHAFFERELPVLTDRWEREHH